MPKEYKEIRESIVLKNKGQKIFAVFHRPDTVEKHSALLICHGLAGNKAGRFRLYVDLAQRLSRAGIAVLRFDYRGCGDSEGEFAQMTPIDNLSDTMLAIDFLASHPHVDAEKMGIFGRSFGGPIAVQAAAQFKKIKSLVLWCPMFNGDQWRDQWQLVHSNAVDDAGKIAMMTVDGQRGSYEFFDTFFKINICHELESLSHTPLLHIHGENDARISIQHAIDFERCRRNAAAPSKFIRLPNTDHEFSHFDERHAAVDETVSWFTNTLL